MSKILAKPRDNVQSRLRENLIRFAYLTMDGR